MKATKEKKTDINKKMPFHTCERIFDKGRIPQTIEWRPVGTTSRAIRFRVNEFVAGKLPDTTTMDKFITSGFPNAMITVVKNTLNLNNSYLARTLGITDKTLHRRWGSNQALTPVESDRLYRIMRIYAIARSVLEDAEAAKKWLHRPQYGLGGRIPMDMIQTEAGAKEVENLLGRIEYGVIS